MHNLNLNIAGRRDFRDELITSLVNGTEHSYELAIIIGNNITAANNTIANASIYDSIMDLSVTTGDKFRLRFNFILNSGQSPRVLLLTDGDGIGGTSSNFIEPTTGSYDIILTATKTAPGVELTVFNTANSSFVMTNISLKKIFE